MKSGFENYFQNEITQKCSEYPHRVPTCSGEWTYKSIDSQMYSAGVLGLIEVPCAAYIHCSECKASYFAPTYKDKQDSAIVHALVRHPNILSKRQLKFLRQYFEVTQEEMGNVVGVTDRHYYSKYETETQAPVMPAEKQTLVKMYFAKKLEISDPDVLYSFIGLAPTPINLEPDMICIQTLTEPPSWESMNISGLPTLQSSLPALYETISNTMYSYFVSAQKTDEAPPFEQDLASGTPSSSADEQPILNNVVQFRPRRAAGGRK